MSLRHGLKLGPQQLIPLKVLAKERAVQPLSSKMSFFQPKIKSKELQVFTRQFSVLIGAGVPIVQSLNALSGPGRSPLMNKTIQTLLANVERGRSLADAMKLCPNVFDKMYVNLIMAGEEGGVLDTVLSRLANYIEKTVQLKARIKRGLWYPGVIVFVSIVVVVCILTFVIPTFASMFKQMGRDLPALTLAVIGISEIFQEYWYAVLGILIGLPVGLKQYYNTEPGRRILDKVLINLPIFGSLVGRGAIARFSRTLSTLLSAGVRVMDSLEIAALTSGNFVIETALSNSKNSISQGKSIAEPLRESPYIPSMVAQMVSVGEQTGNLDQMLEKIADFYDDEVEGAAETVASLIEPILMVVLGAVIATLVGAMYLPIFDIASVVGGG